MFVVTLNPTSQIDVKLQYKPIMAMNNTKLDQIDHFRIAHNSV